MKISEERYNPDFIHHNPSKLIDYVHEVVFGVQDGMVSTLGALTGIAIGSQSHYTVILAGVAIISVESVSMSIGSYISSLSEKNIKKRILYEECYEISHFLKEEKRELNEIYIKEGWPKELASQMTEVASKDKKLMLKEMAYRELSIIPEDTHNPILNGVAMFFAYIIGGMFPLSPYFLTDVKTAIPISITITLVGLFLLGVSLTKFTKQKPFQSGLKMFIFGGIALSVGLLVGILAPTAI